jgi:hypothetical protein
MMATDAMGGQIVGSSRSPALGESPGDSRSSAAHTIATVSSRWNPLNVRQGAQFGRSPPGSSAFLGGSFADLSAGAFRDVPRPTVVSGLAPVFGDDGHPIGVGPVFGDDGHPIRAFG